MRQKYHQAILFSVTLVFLTISLLGCRNSGEKQTDSTEEKVPITIAKEGFHVFRENMDGSISSQWLLSDSLSEHATIEEIEDLATSNDDPIMRLIAFRVLLSKDPHEAVNLAIANIEDTTEVHTVYGMCGEEDRVSNVRICLLHDSNRYHVSKEDLERLDSAMLFSANISKYGYSYWLYQYIPAKPEYEERLRQIYKQDPWALVTLAKYKREKDKQKIISLLSPARDEDSMNIRGTLSAALHAVVFWPDIAFKPLVQQGCQRVMNDRYGIFEVAFRALIAYNEQWSYDMVEKALADAKQKKRDDFGYLVLNFHNAYEDNPQPLFKPLIEKYPLEK